MLIKYNPPAKTTHSDTDRGYDKIRAIKAIRAFNGMGLKESKAAVETIVECREFPIPEGKGDIYEFRQAMSAAGNFIVQTTEFELYYNIEKSIKMAVEIREYKIARALINTLPAKLRSGITITEQN